MMSSSASSTSTSEKEQQISHLQQQIDKLRQEISQEEQKTEDNKNNHHQKQPTKGNNIVPPFLTSETQLTKAEVERYSRQALLPECGPDGTKAFLESKVVVIGCGGLGSTAILFLAASGIGHLVLVDADVVDRSNLHRQIIHPDARTGEPKVQSAKLSALALNPTIKIDTFQERLTAENAPKIIDKDSTTIVLDCSDNVATRYLVNDICVRYGLALVSGAAMRWDGQLSVYNLPLDPFDDEKRSPTYRCMHPQPPPLSTLGGCSDIGVFGPVPGMIGILQALEALKAILHLESLNNVRIRERKRQEAQKLLLSGNNNDISNQQSSSIFDGNNNSNNNNINNTNVIAGRMLVWDAYMGTMRMMKMRPRTVAGVEAAKQGELKSLGDAYDGCTLEQVSDPEIKLDSIEPREVLNLKNGGGEEEENILKVIEREEDEQDEISDSRRRGRSEDVNDDENEQEDTPAKQQMNFAAVRNRLRDFIHPPPENQQPNEKTPRLIKLVLILDVRKTIQRRLCSLEDLYHLPALSSSSSSSSASSRTLVLHLGLPFADLQKQVTAFLQYFEAQKGDAAAVEQSHQQQQRSSSIEQEVSLEIFLSELLLIGASSRKEATQSSEHLRDLLTPEVVESIDVFTLCRRGIDSAKSMILLEKLRREVRNFRDEKRKMDSSLYVETNNSTGAVNKSSENSDQKGHQDAAVVESSVSSSSTCTDLFISEEKCRVRNIKGGLNRWSLEADDEFPFY